MCNLDQRSTVGWSLVILVCEAKVKLSHLLEWQAGILCVPANVCVTRDKKYGVYLHNSIITPVKKDWNITAILSFLSKYCWNLLSDSVKIFWETQQSKFFFFSFKLR